RMRPLRQSTDISENEKSRLATIEAIVEKRTLAVDGPLYFQPKEPITSSANGGERHYSAQPPVMAALLAGPYWLLHKLGLSFESNAALSTYLLKLMGVTLPVAGAAGLVYRMCRLFALYRSWGMISADDGGLCSGLVRRCA